MQTTMILTTTVLPGRRIEFEAPELNEGEEVELTIRRSELLPALGVSSDKNAKPLFTSAADYLASLPSRHYTPEEWAEIDRELREDKDSWER